MADTVNLKTRRKNLDRRKALMDMLTKQAMSRRTPAGRMAGRFYVPTAPTEHLSGLANMAMAMYGQHKLGQDREALGKETSEAQQKAVLALMKSRGPQPGPGTFAETSPSERELLTRHGITPPPQPAANFQSPPIDSGEDFERASMIAKLGKPMPELGEFLQAANNVPNMAEGMRVKEQNLTPQGYQNAPIPPAIPSANAQPQSIPPPPAQPPAPRAMPQITQTVPYPPDETAALAPGVQQALQRPPEQGAVQDAYMQFLADPNADPEMKKAITGLMMQDLKANTTTADARLRAETSRKNAERTAGIKEQGQKAAEERFGRRLTFDEQKRVDALTKQESDMEQKKATLEQDWEKFLGNQESKQGTLAQKNRNSIIGPDGQVNEPYVSAQERLRKAGKTEVNIGNQQEGARQKAVSQDVVTEDIGRALTIIEDANIPVTGLGSYLSFIPGTPQKDLSALFDTIRANIGFDKLQAMRAASKTGGALGQVSDMENKLLQATLGSLEQAQSKEQVIFNLKRLNEIYLDTIHGKGNRPEQATEATSMAQGGWSIRKK